MILRPLLLFVAIGIIVAAGIAYRTGAVQSTPAQVFLGGAVYVPASITSGTSKLKVSVAATPSVPSVGANRTTGIEAVLVITETQNIGGVIYSLSPAQEVEVVLVGGGRSTIGEFTFTIDSQNTGRGNIIYRVSLVRLENVPTNLIVTTTNPQMIDATLAVNPPPTPTPTPTPSPGGELAGCSPMSCSHSNPYMEECLFDEVTCSCDCSPILIDTEGDGFNLTAAKDGVVFDLNSNGFAGRIAWTAPNSDDAWLFLDRNENNKVDNGSELFGNATVQAYSPHPNGFVALAEYDKPNFFGGNRDGVIDKNDVVFSSLRLWKDLNHNGISEPDELFTLSQLDVTSISLDYKVSKKTDRHGNAFRYRAKVDGVRHSRGGRWAWDVFLAPVP